VTGSYSGANLLPNGLVIFGPSSGTIGVLDTMTPTSKEFCLSPYFNKF
jgi:hypothetical protein